MTALYNDNDPVACAVLREAIRCGVIAPGDVDDRSIRDLRPDDLRGYRQVHLCAGAGLWSVSCRLAGWPDDEPIWTASLPCQPWSAAGKGLGAADIRDLWPDFLRLVRACRPRALAGEQVAAAVGKDWLNRAGFDMEREAYDFQAVSIPACAVDAPHRRQRLFWVAVADGPGDDGGAGLRVRDARGDGVGQFAYRDSEVALADADRGGHRGRQEDAQRSAERRDAAERIDGEVADTRIAGVQQGVRRPGESAGEGFGGTPIQFGGSDSGRDVALGDACGAGLAVGSFEDVERGTLRNEGPSVGAPDNRSFWLDAEWLQCADGKARRAKPDLRLLVDGMAGRADLWRLAGNSIVPQLAAEVIGALKDQMAPHMDVRNP